MLEVIAQWGMGAIENPYVIAFIVLAYICVLAEGFSGGFKGVD